LHAEAFLPRALDRVEQEEVIRGGRTFPSAGAKLSSGRMIEKELAYRREVAADGLEAAEWDAHGAI